MLDKKEGGAALTGLSNVIQQRTWSKNERVNKRANKTQTANQMEHSRAKVCAQEKSFTNKALPLFSLFFGEPPKTYRSPQQYDRQLGDAGKQIFMTWQVG
ncbi:MAG: hypothetical protein RLZZ296_842 [Pseudomonadota bacterium]|jgi:hypothetical protein